MLLTGGEDKIARVYSTETGKEEKQFVGHTGEITSVGYPSSGMILTGSIDTTLRLWNSENQTEIKKLNEKPAFSSANFILSNSSIYLWKIVDDDIVSIMEFSEEQKIKELVGKSNVVNSIDISHDNKFILTGENHMIPDLWNLMTSRKLRWWWKKFDLKERSISSNPNVPDSKAVAFSPKGKYFAISQNSNFLIFETENYNTVVDTGYSFNFEHTSFLKASLKIDVVETIKFSSNESLFFVGFESGEGHLINLVTNEWIVFAGSKTKLDSDRLKQFNVQPKIIPNKFGHFGSINSADFSFDGKFLAVAVNSGHTVVAYNTETGEVKQIIKDFSALVWSVAFSPDGKTIATGSGTEIDFSKVGMGEAALANSVRLWDVETGKEIERFGGEFKSLSNKFAGYKAVAYSPDGKFLVAGSFDGKVILRNNETKEIKKFEGHTDTVNSVKFAKDANGKLLVVSGSSDSTTRIWDAATGEEICALVTFRDGNWAVVQTKTGRYDAPNGGEIEGIQWVFGNETIALNQLKDIYYTPNLLPRLLGYNQEPLADVRPLADIKLFPEIVERKFDKTTADLTVKLKNRGGGIGTVRVMVNGSLATEDARSEDLKKQLKTNPNLAEAVVSFNVKNSAGFNPNGENLIEVITQDSERFVSSNPKVSAKNSEVVYLGNPQNELKKPTLYAIVGGVSDYNGDKLDLNFAAKDAEDFANALGIAARRLFCPQENPKCDDKVKIKLLTTPPKGESKNPNELPTKTNIRAAFAEFAKFAKPEDVLVVYFSGHGTSLKDAEQKDTYFFLTQETENGSKESVEKNPERSISNKEILDWLTQEQWRTDKKGIDAGNKVLILDTCAAGTFEKALTRDLSADQILALERLKDRSGLQILMGSAANQSAYEASQYGQGLMTYALLEKMRGLAGDEARVETGILFDYAVNRVPKMDISNGTSGLQSPRIFGSTSIPIGLMKKEDREAIKILESPLPIFGRPSLIQKGENDDTLELGGAFAKKLDEAGTPQSRGGGNRTSASLVFVDERNFPGAYRVIGAYTQANGLITIAEIELKKDGKTIATIAKEISGKDAEEVTKLLLEEILKKLPKQ